MNIQEHVPLAPLSTFGIGGPARFFARVSSIEGLEEVLVFAKEKSLKIFLLGGGSNVLFDDAGFDGLVLKIELTGSEETEIAGEVLLVAGAGEVWDRVVERAVGEGLWGLENLSGIPGTVGGAVVQNIGAYGAALSQTFEWAEAYDTRGKIVKRFTLEEYEPGYRDSVFKREPGRHIVLRAAFRLSRTPRPDLSYKGLAERLDGNDPSLRDIRSAVLAVRAEKFPDLAIEGTAGSFFKNPVLPHVQAERIAARYPGMPLFTLPESMDVKIPLGWLLDYRHGVMDVRDAQVGGARMYEKQFLVLVAHRNSSSDDVKKLARTVQEKVRAALGIEIEPEVCIV